MPRSAQLAQIIRRMEAGASVGVQRFMVDLAESLHKATPKDTTHASFNWIWGLIPRIRPAGSRDAVNTSAFQEGLDMAKNYLLSQGVAYMDNLVHYIGKLDQGWSPQAPRRFVVMMIRKVVARHGGGSGEGNG